MNSYINQRMTHNDDMHLRYVELLHVKTQSDWIDANSTLTSR